MKTKWLIKSRKTRSFVPETTLFTKANLSTMLNRYNSVYFKPVNGSGGAKIVKLTIQNGTYTKTYNSSTRSYNTLDTLYKALKTFAGERKFLLQKGIALTKMKGKPFDIRIMMQKNKKDKWCVTAIFSKVGKAGKVATNYNQGGHLQTLSQTLKGTGYSAKELEQTEQELTKLGYKVARVFSNKSKNYKELGLDVAIDKHKNLHILEVNTRPEFYPLKHLKNQSMYHKIVKYAKYYGRMA